MATRNTNKDDTISLYVAGATQKKLETFTALLNARQLEFNNEKDAERKRKLEMVINNLNSTIAGIKRSIETGRPYGM